MTLSLFDPLSHWGSRTESFVRRRFENPSDVSSSHNGRFNTACPPLRHFRLPSFEKDCILKSQFECLNRERVSKRRISSVPDFERARLRRRAPPLPLCPLKSPERARATKVGGLDSARPRLVGWIARDLTFVRATFSFRTTPKSDGARTKPAGAKKDRTSMRC